MRSAASYGGRKNRIPGRKARKKPGQARDAVTLFTSPRRCEFLDDDAFVAHTPGVPVPEM